MKEIFISDRLVVLTGSSSKGSQRKYYSDGFWYKINTRGYEGLAEELVSLVLNYSNYPYYVHYESCLINGRRGCFSKSFLEPYEEFITIKKLHKIFTGVSDINSILLPLPVSERIDYVITFVRTSTGLDIKDYLRAIATLDMLVLNEDRHFNNLGIIYNSKTKEYRTTPIFDNGLSLLSDFNDYPVEDPIEECIAKVSALPFSGSFEEQVRQLGIGLKLNYTELLKQLNSYEDSRAKKVLLYQLGRYKNELDNSRYLYVF